MAGTSQPAAAQLALSIAVESDYRFRGYSLSEGRPIASASAGYDDPSGLYVNGSLIGTIRGDAPDLLGYQANVGFAKRIGPTLSVDAGLVHSENEYSYYGYRRWSGYTEAYVGATLRDVTARVFYSPHYFDDDVSTLYAELDTALQPAAEWRLSAHVGALTYLAAPVYYDDRTRYDWRFAASRQFGAVEAHAALSGGSPGTEYYRGEAHDRTALTFGASVNF